MRKHIVKIRKILAEWLYPVDPVELTRRYYVGITSDDLLYLVNMEEGQREAFLGAIYQIVEGGKLKPIADKIMQEQVEMSVKYARNMEEVNHGRATLNGVALFMDELKYLHSLYEQQYIQKSEFNKFDIL